MADTYDPTATHSRTSRAVGVVRVAASYTLFAVGIAALVSFFAPYVGAPALAWHTGLLPAVVAPTEGDTVVNAAPLILGVVLTAVAVRIR